MRSYQEVHDKLMEMQDRYADCDSIEMKGIVEALEWVICDREDLG